MPASLWMTAKTARASPVGPFVEGQLPWVAVALQLLHEKAKGGERGLRRRPCISERLTQTHLSPVTLISRKSQTLNPEP